MARLQVKSKKKENLRKGAKLTEKTINFIIGKNAQRDHISVFQSSSI
jgi:hypothetical protein